MLDLNWKQNLNKIYQLKKKRLFVSFFLVHVIVLIYVIILIVDIPVSG